jgi:hypothetical protein
MDHLKLQFTKYTGVLRKSVTIDSPKQKKERRERACVIGEGEREDRPVWRNTSPDVQLSGCISGLLVTRTRRYLDGTNGDPARFIPDELCSAALFCFGHGLM